MIKPTIPLVSLLFLTFSTSVKNNNFMHVYNENSTIFYRPFKFAICSLDATALPTVKTIKIGV